MCSIFVEPAALVLYKIPIMEGPTVYEGACQNCGEWAWVILGLCGDCAPASYQKYYEEWLCSTEDHAQHPIMAEQLLPEIALEKGDDAHNYPRGRPGHKRPKMSFYDDLQATFSLYHVVRGIIAFYAPFAGRAIICVMAKSEQAHTLYPLNPKLQTILAIDYPDATEIMLPFADEVELVGTIKRAATKRQPETTLYIGGYEREQERPSRDHFFGLSEEINLATTSYRQYKLYLPWPQPTIFVEFAEGADTGKVVGHGSMRLAMHEIGQAQAWYGSQVGVIWECYSHGQRRLDNWQEELAQFWSVVEGNIADPAIPINTPGGEGAQQHSKPSKPFTFYTHSHDPAFEEVYEEFLSTVGYAPDAEYPKWWSKSK